MITRNELAALREDAENWRALCRSSPHIAELLDEWREWRRRRDLSEATADMAASLHPRFATVPTYAELERRRNIYTTPALTPGQIKARAAASWAAVERKRGAA